MIVYAEARSLALQWWAAEPEHVVIDEMTIERSWGWMFFVVPRVDARLYGGGGPLIVERASGKVIYTGSGEAPEAYLARYEATGDPHQQLGREVIVERVESSRDSALVAQHLHHCLGVSLVQAKQGLDSVADGVPFRIRTPDPAEAAKLCEIIGRHGFVGRQLPEPV